MAQVMNRQTKKLSRNTAVQDIKKTNIAHHRRGLSAVPVFQYIEEWKQVLQQQQAVEEDVDCGAQTAYCHDGAGSMPPNLRALFVP
ncbi:unnamed protein product [Sphagnum tenellum]